MPLQRLDPSSFLGRGIEGPTYITSMEEIENNIYAPPCECNDCQHGFYAVEEQYRPCFQYKGQICNRDATRIAENHVRDAEHDRLYVSKRLQSHGDIIFNRWKKKSKDARRRLLAETVPELFEQRWIIPRYCYMEESKLVGLAGRTWERRCQLLLPWLSIDVLKSNPAILFALLHNRTKYTLQDWAWFDARQLILSWACGHFDVEFNAKCVVMYGPSYGKLVDWEEESAHRSDVLGFPKARLVLEAQAYLMVAIREIVDKILEGVDLEKPGSSGKWTEMVSLGFRHVNEVECWSSYTNQAFSAPPAFSIDNLVSIAQTRLQALGDHLYLLQTDHVYMWQHIKDLKQDEFFRTIEKAAAGSIVTHGIFGDVTSYWRWIWIKHECEYVKTIHDRYRDSIQPGKPLPHLYDRALGALELLIVNEVIKRGKSIQDLMPQRPGFSHNWISVWKPSLGETIFQVTRRPGTTMEQKELFEKDILEWCLIQLQAKPDTQTNYDHSIVFAILEDHLASCNAKEKSRLDEILYNRLSDLAACHEMLVSIRLHRPQNIARDLDEVVVVEDRIAWKGWKVPGFLTSEDITDSGTALLKDFYDASWPSGPKNKSWIARYQNIRNALEDFWAAVRKTPKLVFEQSSFTPEEVDACMEIISYNLTEEYAEQVRAEEEQMLSSITRTTTPIARPIQTEWGSTPLINPTYSLPKSKIKTRPIDSNPEPPKTFPDLTNLVLTAPLAPALPKLPVKKRAFDLLSLIFPTTASESSKSIEWELFVHAMSDLGFSARNGGGSAVTFEHEDGKKIIFHKPHPGSRIEAVGLRCIGTRMKRRFGWEREGFVLDG